MQRFHARSRAVLCAFALAFTACRAGAIIDASLQMQLGNPSGATADANNHQHYLIQRTVEAIDYNDTLGLPNWASWDLTAGDVGSSGRSPDFDIDTSLPATFYKVTTTDYSGSGYDRGHMCPSADRTDNDTDNELVFLLSNIIPQASSMNSGVWSAFESYCRSLAQSGNELLIICGPGGFDGSFIQPSQRVFIPGFVWKIVVVVPAGTGTALSRVTSAARVIAIKIPNLDSAGGSWQNYLTSPRQIEVDTGLTFFSALPSAVADALRNKVDGMASPVAPNVSGFSPSSGAVGGSVVLSGSNFSSATEVTFNGISAAFHVDSATQITATVPANSVAGPISVTTPQGTGVSAGSFTVTGSNPDLTAVVSHFGNFSQRDTGDTYTIIVTNVGTLPSTGLVSVAEMVPAGLTASALSGVGWTVNLGTLTCTRSNSLLAGASYPPLTLVVNVASNAPATVTNSVTVSGGGDANPANNVARDATTINPSVGGGGTVVTLFGWDTHGLSGGSGNFGPSPFASTVLTNNLVVGGLTRGPGVGTSGSGASRGWGGNSFTGGTAAAAVTAGDVITFSAAAANGYTVSYNAINKFDYRHSATGPATGVLQYQINSGAFNDITAISYPVDANDLGSLSPINLTGVAALQNVGPGTNVTFRIVNYGGGSSGTWYVFDVANSTALDLAVSGTLTPAVTTHPDLVVAVSHTGNFRQGGSSAVYTITVTNLGTAATAGAVSVVDTLPGGLTAAALSGAGWTANLGTLTCTRNENLAPGAGYPPITLVVNVATNAAASLTNSVAVSGGGETNLANNLALDATAVIPLTPVEYWRLAWFGTADNAGVAADGAVSTADGLPNLVKYALGLNPFVPADNPVAVDVSAGYLRLSAPKNPAATDVHFLVETAGAVASGWTTNGVTIDPAGPDMFEAHRDLPINAAAGGYLRLSVERF